MIGIVAAGFIFGLAWTGFGQVVSVNGTFDGGATGWTLIGAEVVATGEPNDNPFGRVQDGALAFLYQKASAPAPRFDLSFDYFTGSMSPAFPSPGGFPDTAYVSIYYGPTDADLRPELFQGGASVGLFDFDAANGLSRLLPGAALTASPVRPGWDRFTGTFDSVAGQPYLAVTFQAFNGNGVPADSAFLVDNVVVIAVPEPISTVLMLAGLATALAARRRCWPRRAPL